MSNGLATVERILFFILGILLLALGVWPVLVHYQVPFAETLASFIDHDAWAQVAGASWWMWALIGISIVTVFFGMWLIIANLRGYKIKEATSAESNDEGAITISMQGIAQGIANSIAERPGIDACDRRVALDRKRPTLTYTITSAAETPLETVRAIAEETERDFRLAFPDLEVETVYKLHSTKLK